MNEKCMHRIMRGTLIMIVLGVFLSLGAVSKQSKAGGMEHRAVWVCFYEFAEIGLSNRTKEAFTMNAEKMYKNLQDYGFNELYFHVRAFDDAIYPSKTFKWSQYIVEKGKKLDYDPLKILVDLAHKYKIEFHAWLNPYRVTTSKILNPGKKKTIKRIVKQVEEIVGNYDVDGVNFDDYFYLGDKYKNVSAKKRKKNCNKMIRAVYKAIKTIDDDVRFGISPAGNVEYNGEIGADIGTWLSKSGYVDYIVPQIYWSDKYKFNGKVLTLFSDRLKQWTTLNKNDTPMYIGLGLYYAGVGTGVDIGWKKKNTNLRDMIRKMKKTNTEGYSMFAYTNLLKKTSKKEVKHYLKEVSWIELNKTRVTLKKKDTCQLQASWQPVKFTAGKTITFESENPKLATVDADGLVTAVAAKGKVKIIAKSMGKTASCTVTLKSAKK